MAYKNPIGRYKWKSVGDKRSRHSKREDRPCSQRRDGDEYQCHCGLRWSIDEDRPACIKKGLSA